MDGISVQPYDGITIYKVTLIVKANNGEFWPLHSNIRYIGPNISLGGFGLMELTCQYS